MTNEEKDNKKKFFKLLNEKHGGILDKPNVVTLFKNVEANGFIMDLWEQWNKQCVDQYGGIRWVKMWTDHLKAEAYEHLINSKVIPVMTQDPEQSTEKDTTTKEKNEKIPLIG